MSRPDVVVDLNGWFKTPPGLYPGDPDALFDTRVGNPPYLRDVAKVKVGPGAPLEVRLTDLPGLVPATGVGVVSINVTSTQSLADGFVTVSPCTTTDSVSSVNFQSGDDAANLVLARVSATGTVCFNASAPTDLVVDVNGWFATPSGFTSVNPARVADTRPAHSWPAPRDVPRTALVPGATLTVKLTDLPGLVPATGVGAVSINVTSTRSTADGFLTVSPCGSTNVVSNVNFQAGLDRAERGAEPDLGGRHGLCHVERSDRCRHRRQRVVLQRDNGVNCGPCVPTCLRARAGRSEGWHEEQWGDDRPLPSGRGPSR